MYEKDLQTLNTRLKAGLYNHDYESAAFYLSLLYYHFPKIARSVQIDSALFEGARTKIKSCLARIDKVISVGSSWDIDELFLVIGKRVEIDIFLNLLQANDQPCDCDLSIVDFWFRNIAISTEHRSAFQYAVKQIRKNGPILNIGGWLREETT